MTISNLGRLLAALFLLTPAVIAAEPLPTERQAIEQIVKDYLLREPELIYEALQELQRRREVATAGERRALLAQNQARIFDDPGDPVLGDPNGRITVVEFFDYRCGYCRSMTGGLRTMLERDPSVRFVLKDLPILGPESVTASKAALAAAKQGRYGAMHWALMQAKDLSSEGVKTTAQRLGLDVARLEADMDGPEIQARIDKNLELAQALTITGTPSFIIGDQLIPGAVPVAELERLVREARTAQ